MFVGMHSSVYVFGCDEVSARKFGGGFSLAKQKGPKKGRVLRRQHRIYIYLVLARQERVLSGTALTGSLVGWRSSCVSPTRGGVVVPKSTKRPAGFWRAETLFSSRTPTLFPGFLHRSQPFSCNTVLPATTRGGQKSHNSLDTVASLPPTVIWVPITATSAKNTDGNFSPMIDTCAWIAREVRPVARSLIPSGYRARMRRPCSFLGWNWWKPGVSRFARVRLLITSTRLSLSSPVITHSGLIWFQYRFM